MLLRPATLAAAGLAVAAEAFLLPPGAFPDAAAASEREPTFKALPFELSAPISEVQSVQLGCPGCDLHMKSHIGSFRMASKLNNFLDLSFAVDHAPSGDRLLVNGFELYPESDPLANPLRAAVLPTIAAPPRGGPILMAMEAQDLGFSLMVRSVKADEETGAELVSVDLQVIEVGNRFVQGLNNIHLDLVKDKSGALVIGRLEQGESQNPVDPQGDCTTMACKWRAAVANTFGRLMKHCGGKMAGPHGMHHGGKAVPGAAHPHHHPHDPHHHDAAVTGIQYKHTHRTWARLFKQLSYSILLPVLIGIFAGISVSVLGMVVGTLIVGLWRVFVRGQAFFPRRCHRRRSASASQHKATERDASLAEEKAGLMAAQDVQDVPPSYTDEEDNAKPAAPSA